MNSSVLKNTAGGIFIVIHFMAIVLIFMVSSRRLEFEQQLSFALLLCPITSIFVTLFLKDLVADVAGAFSEQVFSKRYAIVLITLILLFGILLLGGILQFSFNQSIREESFRTYLGSIEVMIGAFVGIIVVPLFGKAPTGTRSSATSRQRVK